MTDIFDVVIIGSGPAGVSAAFPLVKSGLEVLMVDGGNGPTVEVPEQDFISERLGNPDQWKWMLGRDFYALRNKEAVSPKLRAPTHEYVFEGFLDKNQILASDFFAQGSLAKGGLSNAWGCGVARLTADEFSSFPFDYPELDESYEEVTKRIGVSGKENDDLAEYFALDEWAQPSLEMDVLHQRLFKKYQKHRENFKRDGFRMGRSRVAVLSKDMFNRKACDLSGNCLWGCSNRSLYSAIYDMEALEGFSNFHYKPGVVVREFSKEGSIIFVSGVDGIENVIIKGRKLVLAAGTLSSTRLALSSLRYYKAVPLQSCPTAAFLVWLPSMFMREHQKSFGLGQLSFTLNMPGDVTMFGSTFSTLALPVSEFLGYLPTSKRYSIDILRHLLPSCLVGNVFLPGGFSSTVMAVDKKGNLLINGGYSEGVDDLVRQATIKLRRSYMKLGAILLPRHMSRGMPGSDIHYSCTLPMKKTPAEGETNPYGELKGLEGVFVVDGASLPILTEKSHTLTIMANADRIGKYIAGVLTK